jgi:RNA polymerase-interacting CarD/CdnL/TRCF family regulator
LRAGTFFITGTVIPVEANYQPLCVGSRITDLIERKSVSMDFRRGDCVVHPSFGLGTVVKIEEMDFAGNKQRLFYRVNFINSTVWIPVNVPNTRGIRPVTPKRALTRYRRVLKNPPEILEDDFRKRQAELEERARQGSFRTLCELVRDLTARDRFKPLNGFDLNLLRQSRESLQQEWAASSGKTPDEAALEIDTLLQKGLQVSGERMSPGATAA